MPNSEVSLRNALLINALCSAASGLLLAVAPGTVGDWLGVSVDGWLRLFGIALLGHAIMLVAASRSAETRRWGTINLAMIAPYPLLMVGLSAGGLVDRGLGVTLVLADGFIIGVVAVLHVIGLRQVVPAVHAQVA